VVVVQEVLQEITSQEVVLQVEQEETVVPVSSSSLTHHNKYLKNHNGF
jgi:hypothetical protein